MLSTLNITITKVFVLAVSGLCLLVLFTGNITHALSGANFNAGDIIDNSVFYNSGSMDVSAVQAFLNAKVPTCDTNGTQIYSGSTTRAQYGTSKGYPPPYTCLKDYSQDIPSVINSGSDLCPGSINGGVKSAAQIIIDVSQACGINPQVLVVLLQKEQALVTDDWPWTIQYRSATGYGCPDTAACDSQYYGYFNQVYQAAQAYKRYQANPTNYNYRANRDNTILYNPNAACGSSTVYIANQATANLYIYTPYQPNQAALNNLYGTGDSCSSYGNRNFWRMFNDWFGSPSYTPPACDAQASNVSCVWQLYDPSQGSLFLTINSAERDSAVINSHYSYDIIAFYAFSSQQTGTIPVYRIKMQNEHFYTASESEKNSLLTNSQNTYEGVAFYAYAANSSTNATYPVYRLSNSSGHIFTTSIPQKDYLASNGYTYEGIAYNAPSKFTTAPDPSTGNLNVYRLSSNSRHFYTTNLMERDDSLRAGWKYEGVMLESPISVTSSPVYRLSGNNDHVFTTSTDEENNLSNSGWTYEGIGWYVNGSTPQTYRFYTNGGHFYTTSLGEAFSISNKEGHYEGIAFGSPQTTNSVVYRMYNGTYHFFTADLGEAMSVANNPTWKYEGVAWYGNPTPNTQPVYRLMNGSQHFYTESDAEKSQLVNSGWKYEGVAWYGL